MRLRIGLTALLVLLCALCACSDSPSVEGTDGGRADGSTSRCSSDIECSDRQFCTGAETCDPSSASANVFGCVAGTAPCLVSQTCDEAMSACVSDCGTAPDADGDGHRSILCGGDDCDDADPNRFPGNPEICDAEAHDEDCDSGTFGELDLDGDLAFDATCCNVDSEGDRNCGTDCDDSASGVNPMTSEVCDMVDNDCDDSTDEGFECVPGAMRACSVCGRTGEGMQTCDGAVCAWGPCTAPEACNACDDDNDGATDEDFMCVRGSSTACMTSCGTGAVGTCSPTCDGVVACIATEECNYCDDDGDGTFHDEAPFAAVADAVIFNCMPPMGLPDVGSVDVIMSSATCIPVPGTNSRHAQLVAGSRADSGAISYVVPMGYGLMTTNIRTRMERTASTAAAGGWSVVFIASGTLTPVAAAPGYSRAAVRRGIAVEWSWNGVFADRLSLVRLDGTASGTPVSASVAIGALAPSLGGMGVALQPLFIEYTPDISTTPFNEGSLRVAHFDPAMSGIASDNVRFVANGMQLMDALRPGDDVTVAIVAGEPGGGTDARVVIGFDHPLRPQTWVRGESLCAAYP